MRFYKSIDGETSNQVILSVGPSHGSMPLSTEPAVRVVISFQKDGGATRTFFHMRHPNCRPVREVDRWLRDNTVPSSGLELCALAMA